MQRLLVALVLCFSASWSYGQIKTWENPRNNKTYELVQWEVADISYSVRGNIDKPFQKEVFAIVTNAEKSQKIPLFYNGNNTWVLRYSSAIKGRKTFKIKSEIKGLDGKKGKFLITENNKEDRHGGIVLNEKDPRHFYYEDGSHYFNLAFECDWLFALDYGDDELKKTSHLLI